MGDDDPDVRLPSGDAPEMRASDGDRDQALQLLSAAVGDGRLTLEEYSARADVALTARTRRELDGLTSDLQGAAMVPAQAPEQLTAILANQTRTGRWRVPSHLALRSVLGDCHIELQEAVLTSPVTTIEARTTLGAITIFVPDGVEVRLSGSVILGSKSSEVSGDALPGAPVIDVRATVVLGNVTIRRPALTHRMRTALRDAPPQRLPPAES